MHSAGWLTIWRCAYLVYVQLGTSDIWANGPMCQRGVIGISRPAEVPQCTAGDSHQLAWRTVAVMHATMLRCEALAVLNACTMLQQVLNKTSSVRCVVAETSRVGEHGAMSRALTACNCRVCVEKDAPRALIALAGLAGVCQAIRHLALRRIGKHVLLLARTHQLVAVITSFATATWLRLAVIHCSSSVRHQHSTSSLH